MCSSLFYCGKQIYLCNNCSCLNTHLFRNHVRGKPLFDLCGVIEDATHYFFHCINYFDERQGFNDTVQ